MKQLKADLLEEGQLLSSRLNINIYFLATFFTLSSGLRSMSLLYGRSRLRPALHHDHELHFTVIKVSSCILVKWYYIWYHMIKSIVTL